MELSAQAKEWLRKRRAEQGSSPTKNIKMGKALSEVLTFCDEKGIDAGVPVNEKQFCFNYSALGKIRQFCDFTLTFHNLDRKETARLNNNEKEAGESPLDYRVLLAFTNQQLQKEYDQRQLNIEVDIRALELSAFSHLVVIENRDSFNDWPLYQLAEAMDNPLVVYRGHGQEGKWLKELRAKWQQQNPTLPSIYFGDFDLAGMRIALDYDAYLLPHQEWLFSNAKAAHFGHAHQKYADGLRQDCPSGWQTLLDFMLGHHKALRQQLMFDIELRCYWAD